jgi:putative pyruvate formate lyase activating enzyme
MVTWTTRKWRPSYLETGADEIARRARVALGLLGGERCRVCPRLCKVSRLDDVKGLCHIGRRAVVASYFPHFGEENCLRGWNGSGTIFFSGCNLRCVFCQNYDISWEVRGEHVTPVRLAGMALELQAGGCHNINFVTPEHVVPQILEALPHAIAGGLRLPIVYNTSAYDSLDSLQLMDGIVDVYMPDFKVWTREQARRYLRMPDYPEVARSTVKEMHRQVGQLVLDDDGLARRGLLVRHLVMPGMFDETAGILKWIAEELGPDTYVDLMAQYYPAGLVGRDDVRDPYQEINRRLDGEEYLRAAELADQLGLRRLDRRSLASGLVLAGE